MRQAMVIIAVAAAALLLGLGVAWLRQPPPPPVGEHGATVGDPRPDFRHGGLDGQWLSASDHDGQVLLVNFWATWCEPCVREMPLLRDTARAHADQGLAVIGIALDEPGVVRDFVQRLEIDYPVAVGAADVMETQRRWGNASGALPYTVLVDREGIIRWQHLGEVTPDHVDALLEEWL